MTSAEAVAQTHRPRVLIVEPDGILALATVRACLELGLEPKLCMGPEAHAGGCPGLDGEPCDRAARVEASLITIDSGQARIAAPSCAGGRVIVAGERPMLGLATVDVLAPEATLDYPYDPATAAELLLQMIIDARKERVWGDIRKS